MFDGEEDDSDADKNDEPQSGESSDSDDNDGRPILCKQSKNNVRNKTSTKTMASEQPIQNLLAENLYLTSDNENTVENQAVLEERGGAKRKLKNKTKSTQQGKKRVVHANDWACNVRKRKLAGGNEYLSKKGKVVPAKVMKPPCSCRMKCSEKLPEYERQKIFDSYWSEEKTTDIKRQFIFACVVRHSTARSRKREQNSNKSKDYTLFYYFTVNNPTS